MGLVKFLLEMFLHFSLFLLSTWKKQNYQETRKSKFLPYFGCFCSSNTFTALWRKDDKNKTLLYWYFSSFSNISNTHTANASGEFVFKLSLGWFLLGFVKKEWKSITHSVLNASKEWKEWNFKRCSVSHSFKRKIC